jgi:parallel beta-helix repeat protein
MESETSLIADISERFIDDIGYGADVWTVVDFVGDVVAAGPAGLTKALIAHRITEKQFYTLLGKAVINTLHRKFVRVVTPTLVKLTVTYVLKEVTEPYFDNLVGSPFFQGENTRLINQHDYFIDNSHIIPISHDFDVKNAKNVISSQIEQLSIIEEGGIGPAVVPASSDVPIRYFLLKVAYGGYMVSAAYTHLLGWTGHALSVVQIGATIALIPTGGTTATIAAGATYAKVATAALETIAKIVTAQVGSAAVTRWMADICNVPATYDDTSTFLTQEASSPYYLNKANTFDATTNIDLNPTFVLVNPFTGDKYNILKAIGIPPYPGMGKGDATVNVKNTGNIGSNMSVISSGVWNYKVPWVIRWLVGGVEEIPMIASASYYRKYMLPNEQLSISIPYIALYVDPINMFNPHILHIMVFSGPYCVDHKQFYYYVIDPENGTVSARTSTGMMTLEKYANFLPNETKVIATNITSDNPTFTTNFTTNDSTYSVELQMFTSTGSPIDLHVYDATGNHVGYNVLTDRNDVQFPAVYYGRSQNPERIFIPDASNKTYTVRVQITKSDYPTSAYVTVYALQTPVRPPILGVSSLDIWKPMGHNKDVSLDLIVGESGGQHPIYNVTATISDVSNNGELLPSLTSQKVSIGTLPAGSCNNASFLLYVPENVADGNYTGTITIDSSVGQYVVNVTVEVTSLLDLTILAILENQTAVAGECLNVSVVAINQGFDGVNNVKIEFMIDDLQIDSKTVDIPALSDEIVIFNWSAMAGYHMAKIVIDPDNQVNESRENNNIASSSIYTITAGLVLFDESHGETFSIAPNAKYSYSKLASFLKAKAYEVKALNSMPITKEKLTNCSIFVISAPTKPFDTREVIAIREFVSNGGSLLLINEWGGDFRQGSNLNEIAENFGIVFKNDLVNDPTNNFHNTPSYALIHEFSRHSITKGVNEFLYPAGCSLIANNFSIARADDDSYTTLPNIPIQALAEEERGSIAVLAATNFEGGRVVCIGDGDFCGDLDIDGDGSANIDEYDNKKLTLNIVEWLACGAIMEPPVASFTYTPPQLFANQTITFNASSSYDPDGTIENYSWEFGDGANGTGEIVTYSYSAAGIYNVALTVTDDGGDTSTTTGKIEVVLNATYVPDDYPKIQAAVDAASAGDTIIVRAGIYTENIDVNKCLIIKSENGAATTIVHAGNSNDHVFEVTADYVNLGGFTIEGAVGGDPLSAGIYLEADYCTIANNRIQNNYDGLCLRYSLNNHITSNNITDNTRHGIELDWDCNYNTIYGNSISLNEGGLSLDSSSNNEIYNNTINANRGYGGISFYSASRNNRIYLNNFINNSKNAITYYALSNVWNSPGKITYTYNSNTCTNYLGNYWHDYTGYDLNHDGIGDTVYIIYSERDNYPLIQQWEKYFG